MPLLGFARSKVKKIPTAVSKRIAEIAGRERLVTTFERIRDISLSMRSGRGTAGYCRGTCGGGRTGGRSGSSSPM